MVVLGDEDRMKRVNIFGLKSFAWVWLSAGGLGFASGVQGATMDFEVCVSTALAENPDMALSDARIQQAQSALNKAKSSRLPQVDVSFTAANTTNALSAFGMKLQQQSVVASDFALSELNNPDAYTDFNTRIDVTLPVWNGGKMDHYEAQAGAMIQAARQGDMAMRQYLTYSIYHAYEAVHAARAHIQVAQQAKRTAEEFVKTTRNLVNEGVVVRSELLSAKVHLSSAETALLEAQANEQMALNRLKILMNKSVEEQIDVAERMALTLPAHSVEELLDLALTSNPELMAKRKEVDSSLYEARIAKSDSYPSFNVMVRQEWNNESLGFDNSSYTVAGMVSWNVMDFGVTQSAVDMANAQAKQTRASVKAQENRLRLDVLLNWQKLQVALKQVQADKLAVEHAMEAQDLVVKRYEGGVATMTEVLASKTQLDKAKAELVSAEFDVNIYKAKLRLATGTMVLEQL